MSLGTSTMGDPNRAKAASLCFAIVLTLSCAAPGDKAGDAIRRQIANYTSALDAADIDLASQVWRTSADVSFIHPAGHARGWEEVKGIYKFFGSFFSERKLTVRDVSVHVNGETAWAEFYWRFAAKQSNDGSAVQTEGRETQIYEKAGDHWRLVHVHYSGPAMAPP